jgi:hypothetical protein
MDLELDKLLGLEDSFHNHQCGILMDNLISKYLVQYPMCMNHHSCVVQMDILMDLEYLELELEMDLSKMFQMVMVKIRNSSIRNNCRLRMQLQLLL